VADTFDAGCFRNAALAVIDAANPLMEGMVVKHQEIAASVVQNDCLLRKMNWAHLVAVDTVGAGTVVAGMAADVGAVEHLVRSFAAARSVS